MSDFDRAVKAWNSGQDNLKVFAEHAAKVDGKDTALLAEACKCSVDTVQGYRNAYRLYYELQREMETSDISRMWNDNNASFFVEAAKRKSKWALTNRQIYEYMRDGEGLSIDAFRAFVDGQHDTRPE